MSSSPPLVSIFMPTYNAEDFVGAAIDSVLAQDYENLEIVIGDDSSTDRTWDVIVDYQRRCPEKIKAFRNEKNLGITGNCNEILARCAGTYTAFLAGDDLYMPAKISRQVSAMEEAESVVLCYHDIEVFKSQTNTTLCFWNHGPGSGRPVRGAARGVAQALVTRGTAFMAALSVMARTEAFKSIRFDARVPEASDWLMWIEVLANATPNGTVVFLDDVLARYRRHDTSVTSDLDRHLSDNLTTLALVESKYPWLIDEVAHMQARMRYSRGIQLILAGEGSHGRRFLMRSVRHHLVSWKWIAWFLRSYVPLPRPRI